MHVLLIIGIFEVIINLLYLLKNQYNNHVKLV
jgi:hypothetical protein